MLVTKHKTTALTPCKAQLFKACVWLVKFSVIIYFSITLNSYALTTNTNDDVHNICERSPTECLEIIEQYLSDEKIIASRPWFQYKLYELNSLFALVEIEELKTKLLPWIKRDDLPLKFKLNVLIYYAKTISSQGNADEAYLYLEEAIALLTAAAESFSAPILNVQIANALLSLNKPQEAYNLLLEVEKKYQHSHDVILQQELYANLGHAALALSLNDLHIEYRRASLYWTLKTDNTQQISVATYNLARAFQYADESTKALDIFTEAEKLSKIANDKVIEQLTYFHRAHLYYKTDNFPAALEQINNIDFSALFESYHHDVDILKNKLLTEAKK